MFNITTFLDTHAVSLGDRTALIQPSTCESFTWKELLSTVRDVAVGLVSQGILPGDRVVLYLESSAVFLITYLAIWRVGAVAVPANNVYQEEELAFVAADSGAKAMVCTVASSVIAKKAMAKAPCCHILICTGDGVGGAVPWRNREGIGRASPVPCGPETLCHIQYTSGTTGKPKGAMLTQGNWMAALDGEGSALALSCRDIYLGIYPMGHVGVSWGLAMLRAGGCFVILEKFSLERYLELADRYRVTVLSGMPPVIHTLVNAPPGTEASLASARLIISGGGQLLPSVWEAFDRRYGIPVANSYGLSETLVIGSGTVTLPGNPTLHRNYTSVGVPVGFTEIRVVDTELPEKMLGPCETGEVAIRGPAVALGYWNLPLETHQVFLPEGWFLTGDIGYLDEEGALYITDRKKDMIIMSGWKVYPTEVENVLIGHPGIADVAVFGIPDEHKGEIPVAAVVKKEGQDCTPDDIIGFARTRLSGYKVPRRVIIVPALPRVNGWKLLRRALRDEYRSDTVGAGL